MKIRDCYLTWLLLFAPGTPGAAEKIVTRPVGKPAPLIHAQAYPGRSAAYELLDLALEATAREHALHNPRPTVGSRMLAIIVTAMYDAWAAYDDKALGTRLEGRLRRPPAERTPANKRLAMAQAAFRAMLDVFPDDEAWLKEKMKGYGLDPAFTAGNIATPQGIGNMAANALLSYRHDDGANQMGDEIGSAGAPYSDYTFYTPANPIGKLYDPDAWQQIPFVNAKGETVYPGFLTPHWYRVKPFALKRSDQFRPAPPPKVGSEQLKREVDECIAYNANLTLEQKAIVEFMRDGPKSTGQSGHWLRFAQDLSRRDHYGLDQDVKLFFSVANVAMDAFIAAWEAKRYYNSARPYALVRHFYAGKAIRGWAGPGKGVVELPAEEWRPYSPASFVTPPFPGYVSGHSTVSAACAKALELFSGSDAFGAVEIRKAGALTEPGLAPGVMQAQDGKAPQGLPATAEVTLKLPTFTATAEMAGISRVMGGYHIQSDNRAGLDLGRKVAEFEWPVLKSLFQGVTSRAVAAGDVKPSKEWR